MSTKSRSGKRPARVDFRWQPAHIKGDIEAVDIKTWTIDPDRPVEELALAHLRAQRDAAATPRTIDGYDTVEAAFIRQLTEKHGRPPVVGDLSAKAIGDYIHRERVGGGDMSLSSQRSEGGTLRAFVNWGIEIKAVPHDALRGLKLPKTEKAKKPTTLSDAGLKLLDKHLGEDSSFEGCRRHLVVRMSADTGIRPEELTAVEITDLDMERMEVHIHGKGAKERTAPFGLATQRLLKRYLRFRGDPSESRLLVGRAGPMWPTTLANEFKEVAMELDLGKWIEGDAGMASPKRTCPSLYILKRTFCRRFADRGGAVEELASIIGHEPSSYPMLFERYYTPSNERLRRAHQRVRPLDDLLEDEAA